jgi:hypothetical protein
MIAVGITVVLGRLLWLSVELQSCSVVYNDRRWNCVRVQQLIMIDCKIVVLFRRL